jgi:hypothetical protein
LLESAGRLPIWSADLNPVLVLLGTYDPTSPIEAGWLVAYALWARPSSTPRWPP